VSWTSISADPKEIGNRIRRFRLFLTGHETQGARGINDCTETGEDPTIAIVNEITVAIGPSIIGAVRGDALRTPITSEQIQMLMDDLVTTAEFNRCILFEPENFDPRERDDDNIERSNLLAQSEAILDGLETKNIMLIVTLRTMMNSGPKQRSLWRIYRRLKLPVTTCRRQMPNSRAYTRTSNLRG
jgi:hypothetical protein